MGNPILTTNSLCVRFKKGTFVGQGARSIGELKNHLKPLDFGVVADLGKLEVQVPGKALL
jgi:hypothetical protein